MLARKSRQPMPRFALRRRNSAEMPFQRRLHYGTPSAKALGEKLAGVSRATFAPPRYAQQHVTCHQVVGVCITPGAEGIGGGNVTPTSQCSSSPRGRRSGKCLRARRCYAVPSLRHRFSPRPAHHLPRPAPNEECQQPTPRETHRREQ